MAAVTGRLLVALSVAMTVPGLAAVSCRQRPSPPPLLISAPVAPPYQGEPLGRRRCAGSEDELEVEPEPPEPVD